MTSKTHTEIERGESERSACTNTFFFCVAFFALLLFFLFSPLSRLDSDRARSDTRRARWRKQFSGYVNDPQPGVVRELYPWTAMCVRNVDVHVSCSSQVDAQLAAFFIDPRAK